MTTAGLRLDAVAGVRGGRILFAGLSLALGPGDAAVVTGANGIGKSSLLRIVAGLLAPFAGRVRADGGIALATAEGDALDPRRTLAAALGYWARIDGGATRVGGAMAAMGIGHLADVPVRLLSTGQRRRAVLARTVAGGAGIWLLDEPGNGLDGDGLALLAAAMARHRAGGGIVVAATHQPIGLADAQGIDLAGHAAAPE